MRHLHRALTVTAILSAIATTASAQSGSLVDFRVDAALNATGARRDAPGQAGNRGTLNVTVRPVKITDEDGPDITLTSSVNDVVKVTAFSHEDGRHSVEWTTAIALPGMTQKHKLGVAYSGEYEIAVYLDAQGLENAAWIRFNGGKDLGFSGVGYVITIARK